MAATTEELSEAVFSLQSVPKLYNKEQRGCYIRTITAGVQPKKNLVVGLKGLDVKTN
jgi:hypothetical protein